MEEITIISLKIILNNSPMIMLLDQKIYHISLYCTTLNHELKDESAHGKYKDKYTVTMVPICTISMLKNLYDLYLLLSMLH